MKNVLSIAMLLFACSCTCYAQDPHFSQFFEAPLLRNPSLAGIFNGDVRVNSVYRSQWGSVTVPYQTGSIDVEYKQPVGRGNDFVTLGMEVLYDRAGSTNFTTSNVLPAINYHKALSGDKNKYLSVGFMGGYVGRNIDRSKITTNNQYDGTGYNPSLADGEALTQFNYHYWDGSVGVSFNSSIAGSQTDNYFIGVAYHHFNRPQNSFYVNPPVELNPRLVVSAGVKFGLDEMSYLTIDADASKQGGYNELIAGAMYSYKIGADPDKPDYVIHFGGYLRLRDAIIPVVKLDYNPFSIGFSYDANVSQLKAVSQSRGGFEISISYTGFLQRGNSTQDAVLCPRF
ncbi:MAG TPA: PorP/SprF family type IX secretion system membrane protein [Chitinophagaceae bacterium]|nr:PorP/SprF family type IX secretion system membrane protein [Chitinophagaceae bacterium]